MRVNETRIQRFRNHTDTTREWAPHINLLLGPNGAGKTNIIDAIHLLCMSRGFVSTSDQYLVQKKESDYDLLGKFSGAIRSDFSIRCRYKRGEGKSFFVNESPLNRLSDLIGLVPVVVLSPQDRTLTADGPTERRSFIDSMISQLSSTYLADLMEFRRIVKQRNMLLSNQSFSQTVLLDYLEPWNAQLAETGSRILVKRHEHLLKFAVHLERVYSTMSDIALKPRFEYKTLESVSEGNQEAIKAEFISLIETNSSREFERGYTIIGPHRDDLVFFLDDIELRKYGSQGQHRLFTIALKMAELFYITEELDDLPIFLLDDMFGDLDPKKIDILINMLDSHEGQTFITAANPNLFMDYFEVNNGKNSLTYVKDGIISSNDFV
jgi:DNA replication and repair protein RecF